MTTIPGHNQILQQSGVAQEASQQASSPKPGPDQAATLQQAQQVVLNSTIQGSEESERLKQEKEKKERQEARKVARKKKQEQEEEELAMNPDATGRLLDTTA